MFGPTNWLCYSDFKDGYTCSRAVLRANDKRFVSC